MKLSFNQTTFVNSFPNSEVKKDAVEYEIMDSEYRVKNPKWVEGAPADLEINIDHIRAGATDDHVKLVLTFDPTTGGIKSVAANWDAGGTGAQIPAVVVTAVDTAVAIFGVTTAPETLGISVLALTVAVGAFDVACALFNALSPALLKLSDDGGRFYTLAVVCHAVNRACSSVSVKS